MLIDVSFQRPGSPIASALSLVVYQVLIACSHTRRSLLVRMEDKVVLWIDGLEWPDHQGNKSWSLQHLGHLGTQILKNNHITVPSSGDR